MRQVIRWSLTDGNCTVGPSYYTLSLAMCDALDASRRRHGEPITVWQHAVFQLKEETTEIASVVWKGGEMPLATC